MMASPRTYRQVSALLVLSLMLSVGLPLIQHVCAIGFSPMQDAHANVHEHEAAEHYCCDGEGETNHPGPLDQDCHDEAVVLKGPCCDVEIKQVDGVEAFLSDRSVPALEAAALFVIGEVLFIDDEAETVPRQIADTGPPPSPVSLHVLHETFLN